MRTASPTEKPSILVADDDGAVRRLIEAILRREGYDVLFAATGQEALDCVGRESPDLVLLDVGLPDMEGFEVCHRVRKNARFNGIPIIFLTALGEPQAKVRGFEIGGNDFVVKPAEPLELVTRIRCHLEAARTFRVMRKEAGLLGRIVDSQAGRLCQVREGQESLLASVADFPELNIAVRFRPHLEAGGDFYDIVRLSEDEFGLMVADVAGHDLSVAYLTGALKAMTSSFTSSVLSVEETMLMLNAALRKFLQHERYVTACYLKFTRSAMALEVGVAGHPAPLFVEAGGACDYLDLVGDVLGMHETVSCAVAVRCVRPGDRIFLFTDGVIESYRPPSGKRKGLLHGLPAMAESIRSKRDMGLQRTVDAVVDELLEQNEGQIDDDLILMGVEF